MQVSDDLRRCVVFLGFPDAGLEKGGIHCIGTAFLVLYENVGYLATVRHVASMFGSDPFLVRMNKPDGTSDNLYADQVRWHYHPDDNVDIAVIQFHVADDQGYDRFYLHGEMLAPLTDENRVADKHIGTGDFAYTVGLFRLLAGRHRNLPVVHTGHIALMPGQENIPVQDWDDPNRKRTRYVDGYLIEAQSLGGLSGSPVFVRPSMANVLNGQFTMVGGQQSLYLLGDMARCMGCTSRSCACCGSWRRGQGASRNGGCRSDKETD